MARFTVLMVLIVSGCARFGFGPSEAQTLDASSSDAKSSDALVKDAPSAESLSTDGSADRDGAPDLACIPACNSGQWCNGGACAPCDSDEHCGTGCEDCTSTGKGCHGDTQTCVITNCAGQADLTPCKVVTTPDRSYDICVDGTCVSPGCGDATCNVPAPSFALADTNQRMCQDSANYIDCTGTPGAASCWATPFCGQDAQYGWDTQHSERARFSPSEPVAGQAVVLDNVTGLMWLAATRGNGSWADALAMCDALSWGGHHDWRLPDGFELQSIVNFNRHSPASFPGVFPMGSSPQLWTSWSYEDDPDYAWVVMSQRGALYPRRTKTDNYPTRCVRTANATVAPESRRFERTTGAEPVVADNLTGLVWQGCVAGLTGASCAGDTACTIDGGDVWCVNWMAALAYCEDLDWGGYRDWYLPNVLEMGSIVDPRRHGRAMDSTAFPDTRGGWTSSFDASDPVGGWTRVWYVNFIDGMTLHDADTWEDASVRCVRRGS